MKGPCPIPIYCPDLQYLYRADHLPGHDRSVHLPNRCKEFLVFLNRRFAILVRDINFTVLISYPTCKIPLRSLSRSISLCRANEYFVRQRSPSISFNRPIGTTMSYTLPLDPIARMAKKFFGIATCLMFCLALLLPTFTHAQNAIVTENSLTGNPSSEWQISGAGDLTVQGFATDMSVNAGSSISFKIDAPAGVSCSVKIYRLGYYGGNGARLVATLSDFTAVAQPGCVTDAATGLTWQRSLAPDAVAFSGAAARCPSPWRVPTATELVSLVDFSRWARR